MYKLLLVDDEAATREGILEGINWGKLNISEVRTEKNGISAYQSAQDNIPDILLTDIKMPRMNGIELSQKVREINPYCSILIISGYSETDYLRSAIKLNAVDFVEKPLNLNLLEKQIEKSVKEQSDRKERRTFLVRELSILLSKDIFDETRIPDYIKELYSIDLENLNCTAFLIRLFPLDFNGNEVDVQEMKEIFISYLESKKTRYALHVLDPCTLVYYVFHHSAVYDLNYDSETKDIFHSCECFIITGSTHPVMKSNYAFRQVLKASNMIFYSKENRSLNANEYSYENVSSTNAAVPGLIQTFTNSIKSGNIGCAIQSIKKLGNIFITNKYYLINDVIAVYVNLLFIVLKIQTNSPKSINYDSIWRQLSNCKFISEAENYVINYLKTMGSEDGTSTNYSGNVMENILNIIHRQYADQSLSLDEISRQVFLSPSYICVKFKEYTNKTLVQYMNEYRIQIAISLLMDESRKMNDIAESVGFDNASYFSKTFKKVTGKSPIEYRNTT